MSITLKPCGKKAYRIDFRSATGTLAESNAHLQNVAPKIEKILAEQESIDTIFVYENFAGTEKLVKTVTR